MPGAWAAEKSGADPPYEHVRERVSIHAFWVDQKGTLFHDAGGLRVALVWSSRDGRVHVSLRIWVEAKIPETHAEKKISAEGARVV